MASKTVEPAVAPVEIDPAVLKPVGGDAVAAPIEADHPALDPGPAVTSTPTQNAREMNAPSGTATDAFSGKGLALSPEPEHPNERLFSGEGLLTTDQEVAARDHRRYRGGNGS